MKLSAGVILIKENKIFLAKRTSGIGAGSWGSMGGHVEKGESPKDAAKREAMEEFGIKLENLQFLYCAFEVYGTEHYFDVVFTADIKDQTPVNLEPEKKEGLGWYGLDNLPGELFLPVKLGLISLKTGQKYFEETNGQQQTPFN